MSKVNIHPIQVIGTDPGSVNFGICLIELTGFAKDDESSSYYPIVKPIEWELWNVKKESIIHYDPLKSDKKYTIINHSKTTTSSSSYNKKSKDDQGDDGLNDSDMTNLNQSLNTIISKSKWIFKPYEGSDDYVSSSHLPILSTEIQCGHIKNNRQKLDIFLLSRLLPSSITMIDNLNNDKSSLKSRIVLHKLLKYGVSNEEYKGRKQDSIDVTMTLLTKLKLHDAIQFLNDVKQYVRDGQGNPQKIDDLCDAFLLAVQTAIDYYQEKNGQTYIIHQREKERKEKKDDDKPLMEVKKNCSSCNTVIIKQVSSSYKGINRKEKCKACKKIKDPSPNKAKKTKRDDEIKVKEPSKKKPKLDHNRSQKTTQTKKRKRVEDNDKKNYSSLKKQKLNHTKKNGKITIDLTDIKPIFPKHSNNDDDDIESYHTASEEDDSISNEIKIDYNKKKSSTKTSLNFY